MTILHEWSVDQIAKAKELKDDAIYASFYGIRVIVFSSDTPRDVADRVSLASQEEAEENQFIYEARMKTRYNS